MHVGLHCPPTQWRVPFAPALGHGVEQSLQWSASVLRSEHVPPHDVGASVGHELLHPVVVQSGVAAGQFVVHPPQCEGNLRSVSHPSSGLELQ